MAAPFGPFSTFTPIDVFGILPRRRVWPEVREILQGRRPNVPGESPWGFPIFRPTQGPASGFAGTGNRTFGGIAGGSQPRGPIGRVVGHPTP